MESLAVAAVLIMVVVAATSLVLLHRANAERAHLRQEPVSVRPAAPVVEVRSPAFVATVTGRRYHLGCIIDDHTYRYGIWTTRSHTVVRLFETSEADWEEAWELHRAMEADPAPSWLDHRGAPRSRLEWTFRARARAATSPESAVVRGR
jgi:hypothetical protein